MTAMTQPQYKFADRREAGRVLAERLKDYTDREDVIVLAPEDVAWIRRALRARVEQVPDPPPSPGLGRMVKTLLAGFTDRTFRTARFLENDR